jgi:hypothetical protein
VGVRVGVGNEVVVRRVVGRRLAAEVLLIPHQVALQTLHGGGLFLSLTAAGRVEAPVQLLMKVGLEVLGL